MIGLNNEQQSEQTFRSVKEKTLAEICKVINKQAMNGGKEMKKERYSECQNQRQRDQNKVRKNKVKRETNGKNDRERGVKEREVNEQ